MAQQKTNRKLVTASVILAQFLGAMEATVVATAMPTIIGTLGGFSLYAWVFSAYLLTQASTIPLYGKLSDLFGRRRVFTVGTGLFLLGSALAGQSHSMVELIAFRALQGVGSGAVLPIATTIIGDIYTLEERARMQGLLSSVWGFSSIIGPALGGFIVSHASWRWVFYINVPFGLLAVAGILLFLHEDIERQQHKIDYLGSVTLVAAVSALMFFFLQGGKAWAWSSPPSLSLAVAAAALGIFFIWHENRVQEPILPLGLFQDRVIAVSNAGALLVGGMTLSVTSYIPAFAQGVLGTTPILAGFILASMSVGWPLASSVSGFIMLRIGYRWTAVTGLVLNVIGSFLLFHLGAQVPTWYPALACFVMGLGFGLSTTTFVVSIQSSVDWKRRGVATSSNMFMRMLGSTIWVAVLGSILNTRMLQQLQHLPQAISQRLSGSTLDAANLLLDPALRQTLPPSALQQVAGALASGLHTVYFWVLITALVALVTVTRLPAGLPAEVRAQANRPGAQGRQEPED